MDMSKKRGHIAYSENEILCGTAMIEKLEKITDIMLYFLDRQNIAFTYILMQVEDDDFKSFLKDNKRDTDILIPISEEEHIYAIVCQETDIKGGYYFAERIARLLEVEKEKNVLECNVLAVSTTRYTSQTVILRLLERFLISKNESNKKLMGQINFSTLS